MTTTTKKTHKPASGEMCLSGTIMVVAFLMLWVSALDSDVYCAILAALLTMTGLILLVRSSIQEQVHIAKEELLAAYQSEGGKQ